MGIYLMDCTLRDGGYINDWNFGVNVISQMLEKLQDASVEFVEVGFLTRQKHVKDQSLYKDYEEIRTVLPQNKKKTKFVAMVNCSEFDATMLGPHKEDCSLFGIRIAFHKHQMKEAVILGKQILQSGYKLFFQPMCTDLYSNKELQELMGAMNQIKPYAFYIVDSFGTMTEKVVEHLAILSDKILDKDIMLGFHAHDNQQLAYSNALKLINMSLKREIIIDATISGIGRGAGNLNMELIISELNQKNQKYDLKVILEIYDNYISALQSQYSWGYSIPFLVTAKLKCHPDYANYLLNKGMTSSNSIMEMLIRIDESYKGVYSKKHIEKIYSEYIKN